MWGQAKQATDEPADPLKGVKDPDWQIRIRGLTKQFSPKGPKIVRDLDLDIARGKVNLIIGGSGQGKSVLIKHFIGLLKPTSGKVWVDGVDVHSLSTKDLSTFRRKFGMVFQWAALFDSMSVMENCVFPLIEQNDKKLGRSAMEDIAMDRLGKLGLQGAEKKFPGELSGGMRKRVGLARALVLEPEILLYDEPTTGLDPIATENVDNMIMTVAEEFHVTSVVISHDMASVFRIADRIAMLFEGQIIEQGSPEQFIHTENDYVRRFVTTSGVASVLRGQK